MMSYSLPGDPYRLHPSYNNVVEQAVSGRMVSPRGIATFEIVGPVALKTLSNLTVARKGMNTTLAYIEAMMMVAGEFDLELIKMAAPKSRLDLWEKQSDYGVRIEKQMPKVIQLLRDDRWTRRAIAYFNHSRHWQTDNLACTTALHFMIRNDALETTMNVRSWDLAYGMPMDLMTHGIVAQVVARCINVQSGDLFATGNSVHVYPDTLHLAKATQDLEFNLGPAWPVPGSHWVDFKMRAHQAIIEFRKHGARINPGVLRTEKIN